MSRANCFALVSPEPRRSYYFSKSCPPETELVCVLYREALIRSLLAQVAPDLGALNGSFFRVEDAAEKRLEARIREEGHVRFGQRRHRNDRCTEVKRQSEVGNVGTGVARGQGREAEPPFDQLEDRGVVKNQMIHSRVVLDAASEWRSDDHGNTKAQQRFAVNLIGIHLVGGGGARRSYVLEEAAPLIEGDATRAGSGVRRKSSSATA